MSYRDQLHPWCIIQLFPNARSIIVTRFRRRNDAEANLKALRQMNPNGSYQIVFDGYLRNRE